MKKLSTILFLFLSFMFLAQPGFSQRSEPHSVEHFSFEPGGTLTAATVAGDITVIGTKAPRASVALLVTDRDGNYEASTIEKALEEYSIVIKNNNNNLTAEVSRKDGETEGPMDLIISLRIYVPIKTVSHLNTTSGNIVLNNLKGNAKTLSSGGEIRLVHYAGVLEAETGSGSIYLNEASGALHLKTAGGLISLKKVSGDVIAYSNGGNITADIRQLGKFLTLETSGGDLKATLPSNRGLDVNVSGAIVKTDLANFQGISEKAKLVGSVNGGGVPVKIHTLTGQAELNYRL